MRASPRRVSSIRPNVRLSERTLSVGPVFLAAFCCFLLLLIPGTLLVLTYIFQKACVLCGLPRPSVLTAFGVMLLIRVSTFVPEAIMNVIVTESCKVAGVEEWEAFLIVLFLFLPIDLLISAGLHAGLMSIKFGKGIEVWFVQMLIYLSIAVAITFLSVLVVLARG